MAMEKAKMDNNIKNILKFIMLNDNFFKIGSLFIYFSNSRVITHFILFINQMHAK